MSMRRLTSVLALLALLTLSTMGLAGCGSDDESDGTKPTKDVSSKTTADDDAPADTDEPDPELSPAPEPVPEGELPPIQILTPTALESLKDRFVLSGTASVAEGTLAWAILDAKLKPQAQGTMTASCGAPCRGTFRQAISLAKVPLGSWELHVWSPNMESGGQPRLHDQLVPINVTDQLVEGAPKPGALPPGGAPP